MSRREARKRRAFVPTIVEKTDFLQGGKKSRRKQRASGAARTHAHTFAHIHARTRHVQERDKERRDIHLFAQRLPLASLLTSIFFSLLSPTRVFPPPALIPPHPPKLPISRCVGQRGERLFTSHLFKKHKENLARSAHAAAYFPRGFAPLVQEAPLSRGGEKVIQFYRWALHGEKRQYLTHTINTSCWLTNVK